MAAAVTSPLSPANGLMSHFSPFTDSPSSPSVPLNKRRSTDSNGHLHPNPQRSPALGSPSDIADPSPIASSNGTDFDETATEEIKDASNPEPSNTAGQNRASIKVQTTDADGNTFKAIPDEDDPSSVIHAPGGFESFLSGRSPAIGRITPTPSQRSDVTVISPQDEEAGKGVNEDQKQSIQNNPMSPPPISTAIPPMHDSFMTPRAQTRQEAEAIEKEKAAHVRRQSLEDIPESQDTEDELPDSAFISTIGPIQGSEDEVAALRLALGECWTLCNTLAGLSHIHRERAFRHTKSGDGREQAWKSCWKLCQKLYDTWDEDQPSEVAPTLNLCREFCQCLFEVRQRENDLADSVLRVSFELNNHLYNTHDRTLPEAFRERTLDFYITLCHRLMKQRNRMIEETDNLLRTCWSLAEMLFSLRQNKREGKPADEELLGSAVQSCWDLCDLFREGWTQVRPDRGTPRPSQPTFLQAYHQAQGSDKTLRVSVRDEDEEDLGRLNPETPTTIFEENNQMSPDEAHVPNIVVLGPESQGRYGPEWSSSSSTLSGYSRASGTTTSSASTIINPAEDPRLTCLRLLIIKAAINLGYQRGEKFSSFVKSIPTNAFGSAQWQVRLLEQYKKLVASDATFRGAGPPRRASAPDVARSVRWMVGSGQYVWLKDLFRWVFGFHLEDADMRPGVDISS